MTEDVSITIPVRFCARPHLTAEEYARFRFKRNKECAFATTINFPSFPRMGRHWDQLTLRDIGGNIEYGDVFHYMDGTLVVAGSDLAGLPLARFPSPEKLYYACRYRRKNRIKSVVETEKDLSRVYDHDLIERGDFTFRRLPL